MAVMILIFTPSRSCSLLSHEAGCSCDGAGWAVALRGHPVFLPLPCCRPARPTLLMQCLGDVAGTGLILTHSSLPVLLGCRQAGPLSPGSLWVLRLQPDLPQSVYGHKLLVFKPSKMVLPFVSGVSKLAPNGSPSLCGREMGPWGCTGVPAGTPLGALRCSVGEMQSLLFWRPFKQLLALTGLKPAAVWGRLSLPQGQ